MPCTDPYPMPKKLHFFWTGENKLPNSYAYYEKKWRLLHPDWEIIDWDMEKVNNELIKQNATILETIEGLRVNAMIGDVVRLLILEREGGIFVESDVYPLRPIDPIACRYDYFTTMSEQFMLFRTPKIEIDMLGARPYHPIISRTLGLIAATDQQKYD